MHAKHDLVFSAYKKKSFSCYFDHLILLLIRFSIQIICTRIFSRVHKLNLFEALSVRWSFYEVISDQLRSLDYFR